MALILLRHTRPDIDDGVCYGASDIACAPGFEAACEAVLAALPAVDLVVSSPLTRCRMLAETIATGRALPLALDDRLREMAFGIWEQQRWTAIARAEVDAWAADFHHARPHGGESVAMLAARVSDALADMRARPGTTLAVTHLGVIRAALAAEGRADAWNVRVAFGAWVKL